MTDHEIFEQALKLAKDNDDSLYHGFRKVSDKIRSLVRFRNSLRLKIISKYKNKAIRSIRKNDSQLQSTSDN